MAKKAAVRDYKFSDDTLKQKADDIMGSVERDIDDFVDRGVDDTSVIDGLIDAFDQILDDSYYKGLVSIKAQERDSAETDLLKAMRSLRTAVVNKWGEGDARYRIYNFDKINTADDDKLVRLAKNMNAAGTMQLADLATEGITAAKLTDLMDKRDTLDDKIDELEMEKKTRDIATQDRILAGNALYKEMVRLTNIGKDLYADNNESKYNDYLIYNSVSSTTPPPDPTVTAAGKARGTGAVTDNSNGNALANATVQYELNGAAVATVTTDEEGLYTTPDLEPANNYMVRFNAEGYDELVLTPIPLPVNVVTEVDGALMPEV